MTTLPFNLAGSTVHHVITAMLLSVSTEVFSSMLGCELEQLSNPEPECPAPFDGIFSLIGFGGAVVGNGALKCSPQTACALSSLLLMSEFENVDEQVLDAVGEMTNMIVGGFKNLLEPTVGRLQMSMPSVVYGKNIATRNSKAEVVVAVRYAFSGGEFEITIRLGAARDTGQNVRDLEQTGF